MLTSLRLCLCASVCRCMSVGCADFCETCRKTAIWVTSVCGEDRAGVSGKLRVVRRHGCYSYVRKGLCRQERGDDDEDSGCVKSAVCF